ncbi:MAG: hypothetical protein LBH96_05315 [Candidatus Peribacteria bacterium]|jgi:HD superfamily phosphodiesterase|nr:hypothetical protein [Candidatus Peribacteria bacterium]
MENSNEELLKNIKNEVSGLLGNDTSGHGADHAFRVYDMAMKIYEKEG